MPTTAATRTIPVAVPLDMERTLFPLRAGSGDPTTSLGPRDLWWTDRTPDGAVTLHVRRVDERAMIARAWGPGAGRALDEAPALLGLEDDDTGFDPADPAVRRLHRTHPGVRLPRGGRVVATLFAAICAQKVTGVEARRAWRGLVRATSEPAPVPGEAGAPSLLLPPDPERVAALPSFTAHRFGMERRRSETLRRVADRAAKVERTAADGPAALAGLLRAFPGIGVWTIAETSRTSLGDADAVSVGDFHLPHAVCWLLAGEARGSDERMLELLEPFAGHRGRVQRLIEAGGAWAPKFGPRMAPRSIASL